MPSSKIANAAPRDPRVDDYIASAAPFAREPMEFVREAMHAALPDVTEAIKWSHPFYLLDGRPFASLAAFKRIVRSVSGEAAVRSPRKPPARARRQWASSGASSRWPTCPRPRRCAG